MNLFEKAKATIEIQQAPIDKQSEAENLLFYSEAESDEKTPNLLPLPQKNATEKLGVEKVDDEEEDFSEGTGVYRKERWHAVRDAYRAMEEAYFSMPQGLERKAFRLFLAKSVTLRKVDAAVDARLAKLKAGEEGQEGMDVALAQVQEGMGYWLKICLEKINELKARIKA